MYYAIRPLIVAPIGGGRKRLITNRQRGESGGFAEVAGGSASNHE